MPTPSSLPVEWQCLNGRVHYVQRVNDEEYCCSCPECGGEPHQNGELPDRCRLFISGKPRLWCRRCGFVAFPDQFGDNSYARPSHEELERLRREQEERELARKRSADRALSLLRDERMWELYHQQVDGYGRELWRARGVPDEWQDFWEFGIDTKHSVPYKLDNKQLYWNGKSLSIPIFGAGFEPLNIKHRLIDPNEYVSRYHYQLKGIPQPLFLADPTGKLEGPTVLIEGEIKAAVTMVTLDSTQFAIAGLPGTGVGQHIIDQLKDCDPIVLVFDPGADIEAYRLAKQLGAKRCRVLICPAKIDDAILATGATKHDVRRWLRQAERLS